MSGIFARLFAWFANDIIIHTLSNSKRFQRFAVGIDAHIAKVQKEGEKVMKTAEQTLKEKVAEKGTFNPKQFMTQFMKDVQQVLLSCCVLLSPSIPLCPLQSITRTSQEIKNETAAQKQIKK